MRRIVAAGALALAVMGIGALGSTSARATQSPSDRHQADRTSRVLILSLPAVAWSDLQRVDTPNLRRLLEVSAVGSLMTNGVLRPTQLGDGYLTIGAGTRAFADRLVVGDGFGVDEEFGVDTAGSAFTTRTGVPADAGLVYIPIVNVIDANDAEAYGAEIGLLGDTLAGAGVGRGVIANGDGIDPSTPERLYPSYRRAAVSALMTAVGKVPDGEVDRDVLIDDPTAPFGVRLDPDAVVDAFSDAWHDKTVVLVEGSDLVRADIQGQLALEDARAKLRDRALRDTDRIVGRLLDVVDLRRDAVIVVAPAPPLPDAVLTVVAVHAPGFTSGVLTSPTSQRAGFVNLVDVAPTVLDVLGIDAPAAMEGRAMESVSSDATIAARIDHMVDANDDSVFADEQSGAARGIVFALGTLLAIATAAFADRWARSRASLAFGALSLLGLLAATYLAQPFHFARNGGATAYWLFVVGVAVVLAAGATVAGRRLGRPVDALLIALGMLVALHLLDLVTGAHLGLNTVFGYSANTEWSVGGISDFAFAQLTAAAILFSGLLAWRLPTPIGIRTAITVLALTVVVIGVPFFGNNLAGMVVVAVAFGLLAWRLLGHTVRAVATSAVIVAFFALACAVALARDDPSSAITDWRRTASLNLPPFRHSVLFGMVMVVGALVLYLWFVRPRSLRSIVASIATAGPTMLAFAIVAVLGIVLNEPGASIPGMMAIVLEGVVVHLFGASPMTVVVGILVGIVTVRFLRIVSSDVLRAPALHRENFRGQLVPTAGGIFIVVALLIVEGGRAVLGALGLGSESGLTLARSEVLFAVFAFGFLGLVDDLVAVGNDRGFRGHLRALRHGRVTTGLLKLVGGVCVAVVLVATPGFKSGRTLLVDGVLIALAANFGNLLDRAPGRTLKAAFVMYVPLAIVLGAGPTGVAVAVVMGAAFGLLGDDLRERLMLGDTGANVIGAVLGLAVVLGTSETTRLIVMLVLVVLNVAAELVSFSAVIDRVTPLRILDRAGRRSPPETPPRNASAGSDPIR